jgi:hypothetical protein
MHASHLARRLAATLIPGLGGVGVALGKDDPHFALQANGAGVLSYVRRAEIEALADASTSNCILRLTDGEDIRASQKCGLPIELDKPKARFCHRFMRLGTLDLEVPTILRQLTKGTGQKVTRSASISPKEIRNGVAANRPLGSGFCKD